MADAHFLPSEDQFLCPICLDVFTDPVSTSCGHNFCKKCINAHWNTNNRNMCPMCKKVFFSRPELLVNTFISEMVSQFRQSTQRKARSSRKQVAKPGEVPCDVCTGTKLKALKSCLVCLVSYCETHLEPHLTASRLKRHQLMDPVENLEDRMCLKHDKPLELFCRTDQTCVCMLCSVLDHKMHDIRPLGEECEGKLAELGKTEAEIQQMILKRQVKIQEIRHSVNLSEEDANREIVEGIKVFTDLKESVERGQANLINTIRAKQRKKAKQAEVVIRELDLDILKLLNRRTAVERLSRYEDHLHLLQSVQSLNIHHPPPTKDWSQVSVPPASHEGTVRRAVSQLEETLSNKMKMLFKAEVKRVQKFAVDVTLDPRLILSDDGLDDPERFSDCVCVLGKQSFFSWKSYFEVHVKGKTDWDVGVTRESVNRKGKITPSPQNGYWTIRLRNGNEYRASAGPSVLLSLRSGPQKVGVFVDYEEGLVSFYDVEAAALIYSFTGCSFKEKLLPYFSPCNNNGGKNAAPAKSSPVKLKRKLSSESETLQSRRVSAFLSETIQSDVIRFFSTTQQSLPNTDMAAASNLLSEDQFLCSVCLDVFTDPVTTPCGHNFCKKCINDYWSTNNQNMCPLCKKVFFSRPELHVNTFISEMVSQFRQSTQRKAWSSREQVAKPGEVPCDVCTGTKLKALKSCLVCLASYCETHLEPHLTMSGLKRHQLMDPVENLEDRMCLKHDKPLELFCRTDQTCVCMLCTVLDHKMHNVVPLKQECEGKKVELQKTEAETQEMIQKRRLKIQEVQHNVKLSEEDADREIVEGVLVFTALMESVERKLNELNDAIKAKQSKKEKQAEAVIRELEQEISDLMKRSTEVEKLSLSEDHLHLLQSVQSLNIHHPPPTKDWSQVSVPPASHEGTVRRAVSQLEETLSKKMKKLFKIEVRWVQKFAVDVTLDPETANPDLILSDDRKQVKHGDVTKNLPDNPERFSYCNCVLAKQSFSSGRFYFEVQVKDKTDWDVGVVRESINRKGNIRLSPEDGCWIIWLANGNEYEALDAPSVSLSLRSGPQKVGVFVDYEEGLVSFYDVEAAALIYSFTGCSFKEKLLPYFSPDSNEGGQNSAPLIISPVRGRWGAPLIPAVIG
ncbi:uncharacterized protein LOC130190581 [Pseudoliparis swirei]|uniref:uncharacterized protein LOC130190581 n=1 Tax=Pseudoliparis swirei TaxID=2059687 RepID=UPI0024BE5207|nr:uncharacterized protein LOC130190581 [Pseudoliparis swirei]